MRYLKIAAVSLLLSACSTTHHDHEQKMTSSGNLTAVAIEAPANTNQEALNRALYKVAALDTIKAGYDKFEVVDGSAWFKGGPDAAKMQQFKQKAMKDIEPSATMNIRMYHYNDAGSENAVDARSYLPVEKEAVKVVKNAVEKHR